MDRQASRRVHQKVAPAQPTAVMKLSAPRAMAPPKATPKSRRAREPCSEKAKRSPVTMTATVMRTWATVPLRLARMIWSGPSQGMGGPKLAARAGAALPRTARARASLGTRRRRGVGMGWFLHWASEKIEPIADRRVPPGDPGELPDAAAQGGAGDEHDEVDRLRHEPWLGRDAGLLDQQVEPHQRRAGAVGVDGREAPRMPGVPRLQECQRLGAADFADDDPVRPEPHGHPRQAREIRHVSRAEQDRVPGRALELARVFEDHEALGGAALLDHLVEER